MAKQSSTEHRIWWLGKQLTELTILVGMLVDAQAEGHQRQSVALKRLKEQLERVRLGPQGRKPKGLRVRKADTLILPATDAESVKRNLNLYTDAERKKMKKR